MGSSSSIHESEEFHTGAPTPRRERRSSFNMEKRSNRTSPLSMRSTSSQCACTLGTGALCSSHQCERYKKKATKSQQQQRQQQQQQQQQQHQQLHLASSDVRSSTTFFKKLRSLPSKSSMKQLTTPGSTGIPLRRRLTADAFTNSTEKKVPEVNHDHHDYDHDADISSHTTDERTEEDDVFEFDDSYEMVKDVDAIAQDRWQRSGNDAPTILREGSLREMVVSDIEVSRPGRLDSRDSNGSRSGDGDAGSNCSRSGYLWRTTSSIWSTSNLDWEEEERAKRHHSLPTSYVAVTYSAVLNTTSCSKSTTSSSNGACGSIGHNGYCQWSSSAANAPRPRYPRCTMPRKKPAAVAPFPYPRLEDTDDSVMYRDGTCKVINRGGSVHPTCLSTSASTSASAFTSTSGCSIMSMSTSWWGCKNNNDSVMAHGCRSRRQTTGNSAQAVGAVGGQSGRCTVSTSTSISSLATTSAGGRRRMTSSRPEEALSKSAPCPGRYATRRRRIAGVSHDEAFSQSVIHSVRCVVEKTWLAELQSGEFTKMASK